MIGRAGLVTAAACALAARGGAERTTPGGERADAPAPAAPVSSPGAEATTTAKAAQGVGCRATPEIELAGGRCARTAYSGGGELQIAFANGPVRYVVFGRTVRTNFAAGEPNDPAMSDGVVVLRDGKYAGIRTCDGSGDTADYTDASEAALQALPQADELFTDETHRADRSATR